MGNNMCPYAIIIGERYTYFIDYHYKIIDNDRIEKETLLNATNRSLDPFEYHLEKCGIDACKKLECSLVDSFWPVVEDEDEDENVEDDFEEDVNIHELEYTNGSDEFVRVYSQNSF